MITLNVQDKNAAIRRKALYKIVPKKSDNFYNLISKVLKNDPSPVIRHEACFILAKVKGVKSLNILINAVEKDTSDLVRHEAIEAIGDLGIKNKKIERLLNTLSKDKNAFIKDTAEIALMTLKLNI